MQYFNVGINQYLIMASHITKVKKYSSIAKPLFGYIVPSWVC